jgi:carboxypeptidase C (cathepsin A)
MKKIHFLLTTLLSIKLVLSAKLDDKVASLPDQLPLTSNWYSGLLNVSAPSGRQLHYVFVDSLNDPTTDPVIVWFDGGPGIASMVGLLKGLGPLYYTEE